MPNKKVPTKSKITPNEMIENGVALLNDDLSAKLLEKVQGLNRYKLGGLIIDLLTKLALCKNATLEQPLQKPTKY